MDQVEGLELLNEFTNNWSHTRKWEIFETILGRGSTMLSVLLQHSFYQISLCVVIGPRGGLTENCIIVDTRPKEVEIDHLFVCSTQGFDISSYTFLPPPLRVMRVKKFTNHSDFRKIIRKWLEDEIGLLRDNPDEFEKRIQDVHHHTEKQFSSVSVRCTRFSMTRA